MQALKQQLYELCSRDIATRTAGIKKTIAEAQEAANADTKSSAGDKYETGREMMQQEIEMNMARLNELYRMRQALETISPTAQALYAQPGAVVFTSAANYYIATGAGKLVVDGAAYYAISPDAPIARQLAGKKAGDSFTLNEKPQQVKEVY